MKLRIKATWPEIIDKFKNCIVIKRGENYHVRAYKRNVKNGTSRIRAAWACAYAGFPITYHDVFKIIRG